ncbi:MAG: YdeI/OmpD-associated family protein [Terriglobia bacterium]
MARVTAFTARIKIDRINPYVDVPAGVVEALGAEKSAAVLVKLDAVHPGCEASPRDPATTRFETDKRELRAIGRLAPGNWFRTTFVVRLGRPVRLFLDTWMRNEAGVGVGDQVRVRVKLDRDSRELEMPAELRDALHRHRQAEAAWEALPPSRRQEILSYLDFLKTSAARRRNIERIVDELTK